MLRRSALALLLAAVPAAAHDFKHVPPPDRVFEMYEPIECSLLDADPHPTRNPFDRPPVTATFTRTDGPRVRVDGFCDAADGRVFRARFLPTEAGAYTYTMAVNFGGDSLVWSGEFTVRDAGRRGPVRVDPKHPHHFVYRGTGDHYFWNGTTTYWLLGVQDGKRIELAIDRLARLKVNRIRVALNARTADGNRWFEPQVKNSDLFKFRINPWPAKNPDSPTDPQLDTSRYDVALWQKMDRLVRYADTKGVQVSVIFHLDGLDKGVDPFNGGKKKGEGYADYTAEERYYRYGVARLAAFPNVMWDVTNEWHLFRDEKWVRHFGSLIRKEDPYRHLISVHGRGDFPFYREPWAISPCTRVGTSTGRTSSCEWGGRWRRRPAGRCRR